MVELPQNISNLKQLKIKGDPISVYLFILALEIAFLYIKENKNIMGINIFNNVFLYSANVNDTFFVSDEHSATELMNAFEMFLFLSGLKPYMAKCDIAGIAALKRVSLVLCGIDCIDLTTKLNISDIHFSYNNKLETDQKFIWHVKKIEKNMESEKFDCGRKK